MVYVSKEVVKELKANNWEPNQTNRFAFYHFLRKIKRELNISKRVELSPHTLRRAFTTYQAESGLPLPLLQKLLGHKSIRTTALYWRDIYGEEKDNISSILAGGDWLESKEPPKSPNIENFPETPKSPKPLFIDQKPVIPNKNSIHQDNSLSTTKPVRKSRELINKISPKPSEKFLLDTSRENNQLETNQPLPLTANQEQKPTKREIILLQRIKQLEEQLKQTQDENIILKTEIRYNNSLKEKKEKAEAIATTEKQRADNYEKQLNHITEMLTSILGEKTIKKTTQQFYQLQKQEYYRKLENQRQELEAKIEQPPPWKSNK